MIRKGIKFGMMLQFAIGPMCLMVFKTSSTDGIIMGLILVAAIALVDGIYITLAGCGVAAMLNRNKIKQAIKIIGCIVLVAFGINIIAGAFNFSLIPALKLFSNVSIKNVFLQGILLTASNPLTIVFWGGVFSAQVADNEFNIRQLIQFGIGCVLSTLIFLTGVAIIGTFINKFLPVIVINVLNIFVGVAMIIFGVKLALRKADSY